MPSGKESTALLWSINETAQQLGGVSPRTVRRMIQHGELPVVRVGRCVRVPAANVKEWVANNMLPAHNHQHAGPAMRKGGSICHTDVKTARFGGFQSNYQAGRELDALLKPQTKRKLRL